MKPAAPPFLTSLRLELPGWVRRQVEPGRRFPTDKDKVGLAVRLSELNVRHRTGGPFGAAVFEEETGRLVSVGVNTVVKSHCCVAHAEVMALSLAQCRLGKHRLNSGAQRSFVLASSAQPCALCFGALLWAGVDRLLFGALKSDVERWAGFDEGVCPTGWKRELERRGIQVTAGVLREDACRVLRLYRRQGGPLY